MTKLIKRLSNILNTHKILNTSILVWILRVSALVSLATVARWLYWDLDLLNSRKILLPFITVSMKNKTPLVMTIPLLMSLALWIRSKVSYYFVLGYFYYQIGIFLLAITTTIIASFVSPVAMLFRHGLNLTQETNGIIISFFDFVMIKCWTHEINKKFYTKEEKENPPSKRISRKGLIAMLLIGMFPMFLFDQSSKKIAYVGERPGRITKETLEPVFWPKSERPIDVFTYPDGHKEIAAITFGHLSTPKEEGETIHVYDLKTKEQKMSYKLKNANSVKFSKDGRSVIVTPLQNFKKTDDFIEIDIEKQEIRNSGFWSNQASKSEQSFKNDVEFSPNKDYFCVIFNGAASRVQCIDVWDYGSNALIGREEYHNTKNYRDMMGWINEKEFMVKTTENSKKGEWNILTYKIDDNNKVISVEKELVKSIFQDNMATLYNNFIEFQHNNFSNENILLFNHIDKNRVSFVNMYILNDKMDKIIKKYKFNSHVLNVLPISSSKLLVCERLPLVTGNMLFTFLDTNTEDKTSFRTDDSLKSAYTWSCYKWLGDNKLFVGNLRWPFDKSGYIIDFNKLGLEK